MASHTAEVTGDRIAALDPGWILAHATARVPRTTPDARGQEVLAAISGRRFDSGCGIAVCQDDVRIGLLRIEDVLAAAPETPARAIMDPDPPVVSPGSDAEPGRPPRRARRGGRAVGPFRRRTPTACAGGRSAVHTRARHGA